MKRTLFITLLLISAPVFAQQESQRVADIEEKAKQAAVMKREVVTTAPTIEEHTMAVEACAQKIRELGQTNEYTVASLDGKLTVVETEKPKRKPVVRTAPEGVRQPYAQKGSTYKLSEY